MFQWNRACGAEAARLHVCYDPFAAQTSIIQHPVQRFRPAVSGATGHPLSPSW